MNIGDIPLFSMLKGRLGYLSERQRVISENVANSDTPGFRPKDLTPFHFSAQGNGAGMPAVTKPGHMAPPNRPAGVDARAIRGADSETTLDGNSVVLEEQMLKLADARTSYDAAIGFYQKSLNLLRLAAKPPSRA